MRSGLFTVATADNIDYNPSAATAKDSFHGTGISLMQHPSHEFEGNTSPLSFFSITNSMKLEGRTRLLIMGTLNSLVLKAVVAH